MEQMKKIDDTADSSSSKQKGETYYWRWRLPQTSALCDTSKTERRNRKTSPTLVPEFKWRRKTIQKRLSRMIGSDVGSSVIMDGFWKPSIYRRNRPSSTEMDAWREEELSITGKMATLLHGARFPHRASRRYRSSNSEHSMPPAPYEWMWRRHWRGKRIIWTGF